MDGKTNAVKVDWLTQSPRKGKQIEHEKNGRVLYRTWRQVMTYAFFRTGAGKK